MLDLFRRNLSRRNDGGTLLTYATNISHLLRYCWDRRVDPINLSDDQFTQFIKDLIRERRAREPEVLARDANSVIAIGRTCLDFLVSVGRHACDDGFVGPQGRIQCEQREFQRRVQRAGRADSVIRRKYWCHRAFPTPDPKRRRMPISGLLIARLRAAVESISKTTHRRKRRYTMIKLLEIAGGGRRAEIAILTVKAVREAAGMDAPMLRIATLKKKVEEDRLVPIHPHDVKALLDYVDVNRARTIRRTIGETNDHGILLVNGRTGMPLKAGTITKELRALAIEAGISERVCPHMFRHRFITKLFVALIEAHNYQNPDEFRRALLDGHALKEKVREWIGSASVESLEPYIHLAFDEVTDFRKTYNLMSTRLTVDSFSSTVDQVVAELSNATRNGDSPTLIVDRFVGQLQAFRRQLDSLGTVSEATPSLLN
jgi:integrase